MSLIKSCGVILLMVLLQGCFGTEVLFTETITIDRPVVSMKRGYVWHELVQAQHPISGEVLEKYWGVPDKVIHQDDGSEIWEYKLGLRWNGAIVAFIIPLPLILPVGNNYMAFTFDNEQRVVTVRLVGVGGAGVFCGQLHIYECDSSFEWICDYLPWCRYVPKQLIETRFQEQRLERLIPGQLEPSPTSLSN